VDALISTFSASQHLKMAAFLDDKASAAEIQSATGKETLDGIPLPVHGGNAGSKPEDVPPPGTAGNWIGSST
jgi:hypothetical protein